VKGYNRLKGDQRIKDHWMSRGVAFVVDYAVIFIISLVNGFIGTMIILSILSSPREGSASDWFFQIMLVMTIISIINICVMILYWVVLDANGGTVGKRVMKFEIVCDEGEMTYGKAARRNISKIIGGIFIIFFGYIIGLPILILILFLDVNYGLAREGDPRKRFFDWKAGTMVVRTQVAEDFGGVPVPAPAIPQTTASTPPVPQALVPSADGVKAREAEDGIQPEVLEPLDEPVSEVLPGPQPPGRARKFPATPVLMIAAVVAIIIIAALAAALMMESSEEKKEETQDETPSPPTRWEDVETKEGDITGGGPLTVMPDERVPFEVAETVYQMDIVLSWDPQSQDLDLVIEDPGGSEAASSGNAPGEQESVRIAGRIEPGTWTAVIDPFLAANVHYSLEIKYYHETENISDDLLYLRTMPIVGETGEEHDEFDEEGEYESMDILVEITSSEGTFSFAITDPDGEEIYSAEISGEDSTSFQETVDAKEGTYKVDYTFEAFTGTSTVQVVGS